MSASDDLLNEVEKKRFSTVLADRINGVRINGVRVIDFTSWLM